MWLPAGHGLLLPEINENILNLPKLVKIRIKNSQNTSTLCNWAIKMYTTFKRVLKAGFD